jgi:hypothetical protein
METNRNSKDVANVHSNHNDHLSYSQQFIRCAKGCDKWIENSIILSEWFP